MNRVRQFLCHWGCTRKILKLMSMRRTLRRPVMSHTKCVILLILAISCANTICYISFAQPLAEVMKVLSTRYFPTKSRLGTIVDSCQTVGGLMIAFVISKFVPFTLKHRATLLLVPLVGSAATIASLLYLQSVKETVEMESALPLLLAPAVTGISILVKILLMDLMVLLDKQGKVERVSMMLYNTSALLFGVVFVQILLPICQISEVYMVRIVAPCAWLVLLTSEGLLIFMTTKINDTNEKETTYTEVPATDSSEVSKWSVLCSRISIILALACYGGQRHEYKFTYYLLRDDLQLSFSWIRIINGVQYLLFSLTLTGCGWWFSTEGESFFKNKFFIFSVAMCFSIVERAFQTASWYLKSLELVIVGVAVSTVAPVAGSLLFNAAYTALGSDGQTGAIISTCTKLLDIVIGYAYEGFTMLGVSPFLVTLTLIMSSTVLVVFNRNVRSMLH